MIGQESRRRLWGLTPKQIHAAWWSGFGVQVVRRSEKFVVDPGAEVFLLLSKDQLVQFDVSDVAEALVWTSLDSSRFRILEKGASRYREELVRSEDGVVRRVRRSYGYTETETAQIEFTRNVEVARSWAADSKLGNDDEGLHTSRDSVVFGHGFDHRRHGDCEDYLRWIVAIWQDPQRVINGIEEISPGVFAIEGAHIPREATCIGPIWLGAATMMKPGDVLVGPAFGWDDAQVTGMKSEVSVRDIRNISVPAGRSSKRLLPRTTIEGAAKRIFDMFVSAILLLLFLPLGVVVSILVMFDDGLPIFFGHVRQSRGGRDFKCWKFRTMRNNAESLVTKLQDKNKADGPQVFIENDPRVTRIGRVLRKFQIDELPQLWNVLRGDMSLVGPRPSPDGENQFCPAWREIRLSVRPGITGLWQVRRTRAEGEDFQEWIKYDIEYVRNACMLLDIKILCRTFGVLIDRK